MRARLDRFVEGPVGSLALVLEHRAHLVTNRPARGTEKAGFVVMHLCCARFCGCDCRVRLQMRPRAQQRARRACRARRAWRTHRRTSSAVRRASKALHTGDACPRCVRRTRQGRDALSCSPEFSARLLPRLFQVAQRWASAPSDEGGAQAPDARHIAGLKPMGDEVWGPISCC